MITLKDEWSVVDKWWTDDPERRNYVEVDWDGRIFVFVQSLPDPTWRIKKDEKNLKG